MGLVEYIALLLCGLMVIAGYDIASGARVFMMLLDDPALMRSVLGISLASIGVLLALPVLGGW